MSLFKDSKLQSQYDEKGYVVFQLLAEETCQTLIDKYEELKPKLPFNGGMHITVEMAPIEVKLQVRELVESQVKPSLEKVFEDYRYMMGSFMMKAPNQKETVVSVHQDWSFVAEEDGLDSGTLWIALDHVTANGGGIGVVPYSHKWSEHFRYAPKEKAYNPYDEHRDLVLDRLEYIDLKPGEAILWNHKLLHGSKGNTTDKLRMVMGTAILPKNADTRLHLLSPTEEKVNVYRVDEEFYLNHSSTDLFHMFSEGKTPENREIVFSYEPPKLKFSKEKLLKAVENREQMVDEQTLTSESYEVIEVVDEKKSFFNRLSNLFR